MPEQPSNEHVSKWFDDVFPGRTNEELMTERETELEIRCGDAKHNIETTITMATMLDKDNKVARGIVKITKQWLETYAPRSHSIKEAEEFLDS